MLDLQQLVFTDKCLVVQLGGPEQLEGTYRVRWGPY